MSVYKKLMDARIRLQSIEMKKSGHNKFAGYDYFELTDFIPHVQSIFNEIGLCGIVSYTSDLATLTITDVSDSKQQIVITSPMADANLKGCHPVQNLGAVETYQRRYLWVTAMEILEHDALDGSDPKDNEEKKGVEDKPQLTPDNKAEWEHAKKLFSKEGNLKKVLAARTMSVKNQEKLMKECSEGDIPQ